MLMLNHPHSEVLEPVTWSTGRKVDQQLWEPRCRSQDVPFYGEFWQGPPPPTHTHTHTHTSVAGQGGGAYQCN